MSPSIKSRDKKGENFFRFEELIKKNKISLKLVSFTSYFFKIIHFLVFLVQLLLRVKQKLSFKIRYSKSWNKDRGIDMLKASLDVNKKLKNKNWIS